MRPVLHLVLRSVVHEGEEVLKCKERGAAADKIMSKTEIIQFTLILALISKCLVVEIFFIKVKCPHQMQFVRHSLPVTKLCQCTDRI